MRNEDRTMSKAKPKTNAVKVFEYMKKRGVELTREEIANGAKLNREQVRKAVKTFLDNKTVSIIEDESGNGILRYVLHPDAYLTKYNQHYVVRIAGAAEQVVEEEVVEEEAAVVTPKRQPLKESDIDRQGENAKSFMFQQGYSQGYNDAMFHSHRDAYNAGRKVVVEGLMKLLKIDAKVLMS